MGWSSCFCLLTSSFCGTQPQGQRDGYLSLSRVWVYITWASHLVLVMMSRTMIIKWCSVFSPCMNMVCINLW
ncbi:hypothetical protein PHJA_001211400 [Phtheirospermum japonicum]|uniref:Uncharacterized protein n=1 Tax=Phtheirospermum japonicum TaxID=374723 RepID=A0A830C3B2_9LAMI|nr:hypothetical protein PHJA_001211400 [Phtheirospermum japonicum]